MKSILMGFENVNGKSKISKAQDALLAQICIFKLTHSSACNMNGTCKKEMKHRKRNITATKIINLLRSPA